ncbi:MAG: ABC-2 family transporter protein [Lachnospiraceae bacterium]|nr:ABC-2 family transporter protein [Lachnospiraceae bacterium]
MNLKVYWPFTENELKRNLAYKGSFYLFMLCSCFGAFISYYLWMAIYGSSSTGVLGGFTKNEMVIYIFMTYITSNIAGVSIADYIDDDVREGTVAMSLIKPIDYRMSLIAKAFGTMLYRFFAPSLFVWIGLEVYKVTVLHMSITSVTYILLYLLSLILSCLIGLLLDFCFGMMAFVTTYMFGLNMAKEALMAFLTGQLIPISFFPGVLQKIFEFLPFSSMVYTPVMLYLGKYSGREIGFVFARQLIWVVLLYAFGSFLWKKITKRLIVLGG